MGGEVIVTLDNTEKHYAYDRLSLDFDSSDREVLDAIGPVLQEEEGINVSNGNWAIKKVTDSQNTYVFPKSTAGSLT